MRKRIALLVGTLAMVALAGVAQAAGTTRFAVQDSTPADKMVVQDIGYIGVGTNNPASPIHVIANPVGTVPGTTNVIKIEGDGTTNAAGFAAYRNTGTFQVAGARLGFIFFGDNYLRVNHAVGFFANAEETWTATSTPTNFDFATTPSGSINRVISMRLSAAGRLGLGTTAPTQRLEVNGGVRLNTAVVQPACDASSQGTLWLTKGAPDKLEVCLLNNGAVPGTWKLIATLP